MADRSVKIIVDVVAGKDATTATKKAIGDLEREVKSSQKRIEDSHKATNRVITESEKTLTREAINQEKIRERSHKNYLRSLENGAKETANRMRSTFGSVFAGTFLGVSAAAAASAGFSRAFQGLQTAFQKSLDFSQMKTSLAQFEGSVSAAEERIKSLMKVAQETPGLGFLSAIEGQKRLMGIGFAGDQATKILTGLAKVRILSGSTREDMDAMLVNLVQIASGGQKVTQEIREMATRMPALVKIITDEFGGIDSRLNDIDPKVFVERLADAMAKTQANANQTSLAVENLQDAFDRLYIAIGSIIEQNPEVVAAITVFTRELDGSTNSLIDNESQTRKNAQGWVSWAAKATIHVVNFADKVSASISLAMAGLVGMIVGAMGAIAKATSGVGSLINTMVIRPLNAAFTVMRALPTLAGGADFGTISEIDTEFHSRIGDSLFRQTGKLATDAATNLNRAFNRSDGRLDEFNAEMRRLNAAPRTSGVREGGPTTQNAGGLPTGTGTGGGRGGASRAAEAGLAEFVSNRIQAEFEAAMRKLPQSMKNKIAVQAGASGIPLDLAFAQIFSESRFNPKADSGQAGGLTQFTPGTAKRFGFTVEELKRSPDKALSAWGRYMSFLFDRYGDWELATLAYHQGEGTVDKLVSLLDKGKGAVASSVIGPKGRQYIAQISALSGIRGKEQFRPGDPRDIDRFFADQQVSAGETELGRELDLGKYEKEIAAGKELSDVYEMLIRELAGLNDMTREESFLLDVKLGKYKELTPEVIEQARQTYALADAVKAKKKADAESARAAEDFAREQQQLFEETSQGWHDLLTDLAEGNFKSIWDRMRRAMLEQFIRPASQMLAQLFGNPMGGVQTSGGFGGQGGFGGFNLGGLFGGGGAGNGGNIGPGPGGTAPFFPTPSFSPNAGGGGGFGGFGSFFSNLFNRGGGGAGLRGAGNAVGTNMIKPGFDPYGRPTMTPFGTGFKGGLRGIGNGSLVGGAAGLGGMAAAMIGSAIGGKAGTFLSLTGTGVSIGASFGGPFGALIGGAIGAGAGLISMLFGRDNLGKKIKEAALSTYGITIKDKSVLNTLKQLGKSMFGKRAADNAAAIVSSDEGQLILRNYAEATNQSSEKIDALFIGDENFKGNQFRSQFGGFRAFGGPVTAGKSYVVGERGPELFTAAQSGSITSNTDMSGMMQVLGTLEETVHMLATKLQSLSPGAVLAMGASENPRAVRGAIESEFRNDLRASESSLRLQGAY